MYKSFSMELAGRTLTVDVGRVGAQANGCAFMHYGDTTVLSTATASEKPRDADRKQKEREKDGWNATGEEQKKKKENFRNSIVKEQICGTMQKGMEQKKAALSQDETKESNTDEFCFAAGITRRRLNRERLPGFNDVCGGHRI